ncbi:GNAT family N-acetyltransferase [Bacteriovoracaceae bacterium]|nr:GNAT family N-acetyltransferase [Bacteriovoracaceae bacterium]
MKPNKYSEFNESNSKDNLKGVEFRLARLGDENALTQIHINRDGGDKESVKKIFSNEIKAIGESSALFVAEYKSQIVGFGRSRFIEADEELGYRNMPSGYYLLGVIVKEEFRRKGIGEGLVKARIDHIKSQAKQVYTFVDEVNKSMILLLTKIGFLRLTDDFTYPRSKEKKKMVIFELNI